ncbi:MAG TPA: AMP-binding protein [Kofleriaceae bacterium]|jgi:acyl-CoA synthetase (AMP-forming)/AMP-acid ligase II/SAM-dependent methyltransferase|nr:AMP-binding protein [Kofleriaceae bacterium]
MTAGLPQLLSAWAARTPSAPCVSDEHDARSFAELDAQVSAAAAALAGAPGALAIVDRNSVAAVTMVLAALRAGRPCCWLSPDMPEPELRAVMAAAGATARWQGGARVEPLDAPPAAVAGWVESEAAYAIATSGSTGQPRLALRSAYSLAAEGERYRVLLGLTPADAILAALPLAHAYVLGAGLCAGLVAGCHVVLRGSPAPRAIAAAVAAEGITFLPLVRAMASWLAMLDRGGATAARTLRTAMVGAGPCPPPLASAFAARWGVPLSRNYGSSETGAVLAAVGEDQEAGTGRPMPGVAAEVNGQLWVRTDAPSLGYLTAAGWQPPSFAPGGWWAMGDRCRALPGGGIEVLGRIGHEIRRGGHRIMPAEVAAAIERHPAIEDVVVSGEPDGDGEEAVVARVVLRPGATATRGELLAHLGALLSAHKHPTVWHFVDELPRTWSGKPAAPAASRWALGLRGAAMAYRATELVVAARELGLLDALDAGGSAVELAGRLALDAEAVALVLPVLAALGIARCDGERWRAAQRTDAASHGVIALEAALRRSWLTADQIAAVLRGGVAARAFDRAEPAAGFTRLYRDVMAGDASRLHARLLARRLRGDRAPERVLEIGRALGPLTEVLRARHPALAADFIATPPAPPVTAAWLAAAAPDIPVCGFAELAPPAAHYDLIHISNAVHWLPPGQAPEVWRALRRGLRPGGRLWITDLFQPDAPGDATLWRLDWLTHGGSHALSVAELAASLAIGGPVPQVHHFDGLELITLEQRDAYDQQGTPST